jgi:hypothetical protein
MNNLDDKIVELTDEWYNLIGPDHHKDRDCHWYIETVWSYGRKPVYIVKHYGYILDRIEENWDTYELAQKRLIEILTQEIEEYRKQYEI